MEKETGSAPSKANKSKDAATSSQFFETIEGNSIIVDNEEETNAVSVTLDDAKDENQRKIDALMSLERVVDESHDHGSSAAGDNKKKASRPVKRYKPYKKGRTKKPDDAPRRALSAYNYFFAEQRRLIVDERTRMLHQVQQKQQKLSGTDTGRADTTIGQINNKTKKAKISFEELARIIGQRWKEISSEELAHYKAMADEDVVRYKKELETYNEKKEENNREFITSMPENEDLDENDSKRPADTSSSTAPKGLMQAKQIQQEHQALRPMSVPPNLESSSYESRKFQGTEFSNIERRESSSSYPETTSPSLYRNNSRRPGETTSQTFPYALSLNNNSHHSDQLRNSMISTPDPSLLAMNHQLSMDTTNPHPKHSYRSFERGNASTSKTMENVSFNIDSFPISSYNDPAHYHNMHQRPDEAYQHGSSGTAGGRSAPTEGFHASAIGIHDSAQYLTFPSKSNEATVNPVVLQNSGMAATRDSGAAVENFHGQYPNEYIAFPSFHPVSYDPPPHPFQYSPPESLQTGGIHLSWNNFGYFDEQRTNLQNSSRSFNTPTYGYQGSPYETDFTAKRADDNVSDSLVDHSHEQKQRYLQETHVTQEDLSWMEPRPLLAFDETATSTEIISPADREKQRRDSRNSTFSDFSFSNPMVDESPKTGFHSGKDIAQFSQSSKSDQFAEEGTHLEADADFDPMDMVRAIEQSTRRRKPDK